MDQRIRIMSTLRSGSQTGFKMATVIIDLVMSGPRSYAPHVSRVVPPVVVAREIGSLTLEQANMR
eukprot:7085762-Pyramimonas_sp.AAC.1